MGDSVASDSLWRKGENKNVVGEGEKKWMKVNFKKKEKAAVRGRQQSSQGTSKFPCDVKACGERGGSAGNAQIWKHLQTRESSSWQQQISTAQLLNWESFSGETPPYLQPFLASSLHHVSGRGKAALSLKTTQQPERMETLAFCRKQKPRSFNTWHASFAQLPCIAYTTWEDIILAKFKHWVSFPFTPSYLS